MSLENRTDTDNNFEFKREELGEGGSFNDIKKNLQEKALAEIKKLTFSNEERYTKGGNFGKALKMMTEAAVYSNNFPKNVA